MMVLTTTVKFRRRKLAPQDPAVPAGSTDCRIRPQATER